MLKHFAYSMELQSINQFIYILDFVFVLKGIDSENSLSGILQEHFVSHMKR